MIQFTGCATPESNPVFPLGPDAPREEVDMRFLLVVDGDLEDGWMLFER